MTKVGVHVQKETYPHGNPFPINKRGKTCPNDPDDGCKQFAYTDQRRLEGPMERGVTLDPEARSAVILGVPALPPASYYKVVGYSDDDRICATARDVPLTEFTQVEVDLCHTYDLSRLSEPLPRKAFLRGDIIRQNQRGTGWCGPYSLSLAASYWYPETYGPTKKNGKWFNDNVEDQILIFGDIVPGTLQSTLLSGAHVLGFSSEGRTAFGGDTAPGVGQIGPGLSAELQALDLLKQWIYAGVPVIVAVDEHMTDGVFHWGKEHYKVLVGYDDDAVLRYEDNDGNVAGEEVGAMYFVNSGAFGAGETAQDVADAHGVPTSLRETHSDFSKVPVGNDVDSYKAFVGKWRVGGVGGITDDYWYFPMYPRQAGS